MSKTNLTFKRLHEVNAKRSKVWVARTGVPITDAEDLLFRSNEMGGECGEAQDAVKKLVRTLWNMKGQVLWANGINDLAKELADVVICADRVAEAAKIDLGVAIINKFNETSAKHDIKVKL